MCVKYVDSVSSFGWNSFLKPYDFISRTAFLNSTISYHRTFLGCFMIVRLCITGFFVYYRIVRFRTILAFLVGFPKTDGFVPCKNTGAEHADCKWSRRFGGNYVKAARHKRDRWAG